MSGPGPGQEREYGYERAALRQGTALRALVEHRRDGDARGQGQGQGQGQERNEGHPVDLEPGCAYGVVTRQKVDDLFGELRLIRARVDSLFTLMVGGIALDLLLRLAGWR